MDPGSVAHPPPSARHCDHCGRAVRETQHTRTSYQVDYYAMHTGDGEWTSFQSDDGEAVPYVRLLNTVEITTCAECYRSPEVLRERDRRFHTEAFSVEAHKAEA